ncbi:alkaline phosphatase D family protein [Saccharopolyspora sp. NPDC047091]|uniref:DUF7800 domain-containing protein n=1 Tax=Saccharopolyspora sp. NPDC047091 TaxID=3155924 RepID=UPI0033D9A433
MTNVVLGPILRYTDDTSATVWLELDEACTVEVLGTAADTFQVGGHHYALVALRGLRPGTSTPYDVRVGGAVVWPAASDTHPPSRIRTVPPGAGARLVFGSCRFGPTEDAGRRRTLGPDALESCARRLMDTPERDWPHAMLFLGDQVYADQTAPEVQRELAAHRDLREPPGEEIADFEEYTVLYRHAWGDPLVRWLLSTVPSMMIFDDHDVRDDWNTSLEWRTAMSAQPWWRERLLGALVGYWVYQHIGNLSPDDLDADPTYRAVLAAGRTGDALPVLREFAAAADTELRTPGTAEEVGGPRGRYKDVRWSYRRDLGALRLIVLDTRAGRILEGGSRAMLSDVDFDWLREQLRLDPAQEPLPDHARERLAGSRGSAGGGAANGVGPGAPPTSSPGISPPGSGAGPDDDSELDGGVPRSSRSEGDSRAEGGARAEGSGLAGLGERSGHAEESRRDGESRRDEESRRDDDHRRNDEHRRDDEPGHDDAPRRDDTTAGAAHPGDPGRASESPEHVVIASSLPWLLPHAVHHLQAWNEAACTDRGRWPKLAERVRQAGDLEHWAAFGESFDRLSELLREAADRPDTASVSVLSGDVHHSYVAEAVYAPATRSRVVQVTCSPLHNATPAHLTTPLRMAWARSLAALFRGLGRRLGVPPLPLAWARTAGPYFGNAIGVLDVDGAHAVVALQRAEEDGALTTIHRSRLS